MTVTILPAGFTDATAATPAIRRAVADARKRVFRRARRERIAAKESFLRSGH